jgi:hypothetical protein
MKTAGSSSLADSYFKIDHVQQTEVLQGTIALLDRFIK